MHKLVINIADREGRLKKCELVRPNKIKANTERFNVRICVLVNNVLYEEKLLIKDLQTINIIRVPSTPTPQRL